jgi:hypothetical protein
MSCKRLNSNRVLVVGSRARVGPAGPIALIARDFEHGQAISDLAQDDVTVHRTAVATSRHLVIDNSCSRNSSQACFGGLMARLLGVPPFGLKTGAKRRASCKCAATAGAAPNAGLTWPDRGPA